MPSATLAESAKLIQNPLVQGVIESIVTVNPMYQFLPFDAITGNALLYNRENAIGGVAPVGIGGGSNTIAAGSKTAATFTAVTTPLKALIGDAMVDHFIETTMSTDNSQRGVQVASKAKGLGREFQRQMILGDSGGTPAEFDGLAKLIGAGHAQLLDKNSAVLTLDVLDELYAKVKSKDGEVDFIMMNDQAIRKYMSVLRTLGGANITEVVQMPDGSTRNMLAYRGTPIFRNDWIPTTGTVDLITDIYMGCFDDGSRKVGISGLTSSVQAGIFVSDVGEAEDTNDTITRLRFYAALAVFSELGIARASEVKIN